MMRSAALGVVLLALAACTPDPPERASDAHTGPTCEVDRPIVFGDLDWDSSRFHVAVAGHVIRVGYGCAVDAIPGSTIPLITALGRGDVDVLMEIWTANVPEAWSRAEARGAVRTVGVNVPDATQAWYVPRYLVEGDPDRGIEAAAPDLRHVRDLPRHKELFRDPEEPDRGRFHGCIAGWACDEINEAKLAAYGLDEHYTYFRPGTAAALDAAIASAHERGKPVLAYYWSPSWLLGVYDLLPLEEPPHDPATWDRLVETRTGASAYPTTSIEVAVNTGFAKTAPELAAMLGRYRTSSALVGEGLAHVKTHEGATMQDAALAFLRTHPDVWTTWVPDDVRDRIRASL